MDLISLGLGLGSAVLGGIGGQSQADAQNEAIDRQYEYDMTSWRYGKKTTKADYKHNVKQWRINKRNDKRVRKWQDATNLQDWEYNLKIQDYEYASEMRQYNKSNEIADQQLTFNAMAQKVANEAEYRKLEDSTKEIAFQNQDIILKAVQSEGAAAVKGQQGRSADKAGQAELASLGRNQAILAESLLSARADTEAAMKKIATDKFGADLAANAARKLESKRLPRPPKPLRTPRTKFLKPRRPKKYDFGPKPIKGAKASSAGAWLGAGADALGAVGSAYLASKGPGKEPSKEPGKEPG
jgi:hypothetical protein